MTYEGREAGIRSRAFGESFDEFSSVREKFSNALRDMRERGRLLSAEISADMPQFTQHDVTHMDAIWELADLIAGPDVTLNPAEAFVFGASIIVHDLAMSRAAHNLSGGVRNRPDWPDTLAGELRLELGRSPHPSELATPPEEAASKAERYLFRQAHAELAESLPLASWPGLDGATQYLIADQDIRAAYGHLVGEIAASHHWNIDQVSSRLSAPVGAPGFAPVGWKVDSLYLACLLRAADAAHLDATRAPDVLAAVRNLSADSRDHWLFQSKLQRPYLRNEKLCFTAPAGFSREEMDAWWLAYDTLRMVDDELKNSDTILLSAGRRPFQVRGVSSVESPSAFSAVVPCREWEPVEARVKVGDVAGLVRRLGGAELYGQDWTVGLREILTNACDAVKARESLVEYRGGRRIRGRVSVSVDVVDDQVWLSCNDNGIGMTSNILGNELLDFGCSSWLSPEAARVNPGLIASRFEPKGKFGIGFFSIFMLGDRVQVISRALSAGLSDTWVLEFPSGLNKRPTLRKALPAEQLDEPGTTVKVAVDSQLSRKSPEGAVYFHLQRETSEILFSSFSPISEVIPYIMPAAECDLWVEEGLDNDPILVVAKDDWITLGGYELMCRVLGITSEESREDDPQLEEFARIVGSELSTVHDASGRPVGRLCVVPEIKRGGFYSARDSSIVTAGPARTRTSLYVISGLLLGRPYRAARDSAIPEIEISELAKWATREANRLTAKIRDGSLAPAGWCEDVVEQILQLGGDASDFPVWPTAQGLLSEKELVTWIAERSEVIVTHPLFSHVRAGRDDFLIDLADNVLVYEWSYREPLWKVRNWPTTENQYRGCSGMLIRSIAEAWNVPFDAVAEASQAKERNFDVGTYEGKQMKGDGTIFTRDSFTTMPKPRDLS